MEQGIVKQEIFEISIEDTYFSQIENLKELDDKLVLSYITHKCLCCEVEIDRFTLDAHMLDVHKVQVFKEGLQVWKYKGKRLA